MLCHSVLWRARQGVGGASRVFASIRASTGDVRVRNLVGLLGWLGGRPPPARVATVSPLSSSAESLALSRLPIAEQTAACIVSGSCGCLLSLARVATVSPLSSSAESLALSRLPRAEQTVACIVSGSCGCLLSLARIAEAPPTTAQLLRLLRLK
jgi:hypothetical protein